MAGIDELPDEELVRLTLQGQTDCYRPLVSRYQGHVYGLAYSLVGDWAEAQDIAQETFIRAYSNLDKLRDGGKFAAWLRRVAFGVTMDWLRAFRPKLFAQFNGQVDLDRLEIPDFAPGPAEVAERRELADAVLRAVASLPPKYRVPLTMFHLDGLSYQKVASFLDIPLGTAKSIIHRAQEKLRAALSAAGKEAVMVQEVFNEHKLEPEFAEKILAKVPPLGWGRGKECTFLGALEAALAATPHPFSYADLMGFTALAFRVRWLKPTPEKPIRWCPSCAVGEMDEEIAAACKATGWAMRVEFHWDEQQRQAAANVLRQSIDQDRPVVAYDSGLNMGVVYGYRAKAQTVFFRGYDTGDTPQQVPLAKLGWMWLYLGEHNAPLDPRQATMQSLHFAVRNWERGSARAGPGEYWYGPAALGHWMADLKDLSASADEKHGSFFHVNSFNFRTLVDARQSAIPFLRQTAAPALPLKMRPAVMDAADVYDRGVAQLRQLAAAQPCFLLMGQSSKWSAQVRDHEQEALAVALEMDQAAIACLKKALAADEGPNLS